MRFMTEAGRDFASVLKSHGFGEEFIDASVSSIEMQAWRFGHAEAIDYKKSKYDTNRDELLIFLAARLVNVYGENRNADYIYRAEELSGGKIDVDVRR